MMMPQHALTSVPKLVVGFECVHLLEVLQNEVIIEEGEVTAEAILQRVVHCALHFRQVYVVNHGCLEDLWAACSSSRLWRVCTSRQCVMAIAKTLCS